MGLDLTVAQAAWHPLLEISNVVRETTAATVQWSLDSADLRDANSYGDARGLGYDANSANVPTATTNVYGRASAAMQFNGTTDRLEADAALAVLGDDVTGGIALWCKPDDGIAFGGHTLVALGDTNAATVILLKITSAGIVLASCKGAGAASWTFYITAAVFTDGPQPWTHIALVQDGTGPALYINGVRIPSADCTWTNGEGSSAWLADVPGVDNVRIGCENYNSVADAEFFDGAICDVRIYSYAPTAQTINQLGAGTTLRYSDVDLALSDGTLYEGRIRAFSPLRQDLGRLLEAQFVLPELTISLRNADDAVSTLLSANANFVGLACVLKMGQGTTSTDYEVKFTGEVRYPDGVTQDDEVVSLVFTDALEADNAIMPAHKIFPTDYPRAELRARFLPIPEVLGDWRSTAGGGETVPGYCVDTAAAEAGSTYVALWTLRAAKMEDATTFTDSSGNAYHATSGAGAPSFLTSHAGVTDGAMDLDGTTDYLNGDAALASISNDTVGTVAMWVRADNVAGALYQALFSVGDTNASEHFILTTMKYGANGVLVVFCRAANVVQWGFISSLITPIFVSGQNTWTHVAIVQDGAAPKLYVNGVDRNVTIQGATPATWFAGLTGADNVRVGCKSDNSVGNEWFFDGGISDVRLYSTALTAYEVQQQMRVSGQFTFGQHLDSIEAVYLNGVACDYTVDQLTGPSLVSIADPYDGTTDSVSAHVHGRLSSDSGNTGAPTAWMYDLLTQSWAMGLSATTRVDAASFTAAHTEYGASDKCRRWIGSDVQVATLLAELCHDGFVELVLGDDGKYRPEFRTSTSLSSVPLYRAVDIVQSGTGRAIRAMSDPERTYANQIAYDYRAMPPLWSGETLQQQREFNAGGVEDDTAEQTTTGRTTRRRIYCRWLYVSASARAQLDLQAFALRLEIVDLLLHARGLMLEKGDFFQLIYGNRFGASEEVGTLYQVRSVAPDYGDVTAAVTGWNIDSLAPRRYHGDGDVAWALATLRAKAALGYYGAFSGDDDQLYA